MRLGTGISLLLLVFAWGCSEPTIDTSSDEAMSRSIERVRESLPEEDRERFDQAIEQLSMSEISWADIMSAGSEGGAETIAAKVKDRLSGKTGEEILAEAAEIQAEREREQQERERQQREQALQEIAELQAKVEQAEEHRKQLSAFEVERSRFFKESRRFGGPQPIIELTVRNGTEHAVSRAFMVGTLASPGRSVPWLEEDFNYDISGGLEPGESATWRLAPNMFSDWGSVKAPEDAVFTVEVTKLNGPDGETLFDSKGLSEYEQKRLEKLTEEYGSTE